MSSNLIDRTNFVGVSPSPVKAVDSESTIRRFESYYPCHETIKAEFFQTQPFSLLHFLGQSSGPSFEGGLEIHSIRPQSAVRLASKQPIAEPKTAAKQPRNAVFAFSSGGYFIAPGKMSERTSTAFSIMPLSDEELLISGKPLDVSFSQDVIKARPVIELLRIFNGNALLFCSHASASALCSRSTSKQRDSLQPRVRKLPDTGQQTPGGLPSRDWVRRAFARRNRFGAFSVCLNNEASSDQPASAEPESTAVMALAGSMLMKSTSLMVMPSFLSAATRSWWSTVPLGPTTCLP